MAAEITLFRNIGNRVYPGAQVATDPFASYNASFTPAYNCVMRVYADGANVMLTINTFSFTIPNGAVEYFGVQNNTPVTVA